MADFTLVVGVTPDVSYEKMQTEITALYNKLNTPLKINIDITSGLNKIAKLQEQINALYASMNTGASGNISNSSTTSNVRNIVSAAKSASSGMWELSKRISDYVGNAKNAAAVTSTYTNKMSGVSATVREVADAENGLQTAAVRVSETFQTSAQAAQQSAQATREQANAAKQYESVLASIESKQRSVSNVKNGTSSDAYKDLETYKAQLSVLYSEYGDTGDYSKFTVGLTELQAGLTQAKSAADAYIQTQRNLTQAAQQSAQATREQATQISAAQTAERQYGIVMNSARTALEKYTTASISNKETSRTAYSTIKQEAQALETLHAQYKNGAMGSKEFSAAVAAAKTNIASATETIKANGDATKSLGDKISNLAGKFTSWLSISQVIMFAYQAVKKMVSSAIELDTAMTELKKVTDETDTTYASFLENASDRATELGASLTDIVNATADFARLGFSIDEASDLADVATVYKNVGDDIDSISDASDSIIATMQAFGIEASEAMTIVDKFNAVGNNYAISSGGIGEALLRSAASMEAAGNTLDETIALVTAANTVVQNPESVGEFAPNNTVTY